MTDANDFTVTTTTVTSYSVSDIVSQITNLQQQIAQITSDALTALPTNQIAPMQAQITALQALLTQAQAAGIDTSAASSIPDTSSVTDTLATLKTSALAIATPQAASLNTATPTITTSQATQS